MNDKTIALELRKIIGASRPKVFAAWTKPEIVRQWFAPGPMTVGRAEIDLRTGGRYLIEMKGADGSFVVSGDFREIVPDERLAFTWAWQTRPPGAPEEPTLVVVTFRDSGENTEVHLRHERFLSQESCDKHNQGWQGCLDKLASQVVR